MNVPALPRKDRRALLSEAQRVYGIQGPAALTIHEAYEALRREDAPRAAQLAQEVTQSNPGCHHAWIVLGQIALGRREGATALRFFEEAQRCAPGDRLVLAGLGKAKVLEGAVFEAVGLFAQAMRAGSSDQPMIRLYVDLMIGMNRLTEAADALRGSAARLKEAPLYHLLAEIYLAAENYAAAIEAFDTEYRLAPEDVEARIGQVKAALYRNDFARVEALTAALLAENPGLDELFSLRMSALRNLGRTGEALALLDAPFTNPVYYKRALLVSAHVHLDLGDRVAAGHAFRAADAVCDEESLSSGRAFGTYCFAESRFREGAPFYARRHPEVNRGKIPYDCAAPENLTGRTRLFLMQEQGIGDQLALMPLFRLAPLAEGAEVVFVGDARLEAALEGNTLGLGFREELSFADEKITRGEIAFVGDLTRYIPDGDGALSLGGYLAPDRDRAAALRQRYARMAGGAPVLGIAWRSGDRLTGWHRTVRLADLVAILPQAALVVNLQYGDCRAELDAARRLRPDLQFFEDPEIDQMRDLAGFLCQIDAIDRIITIDNTTAHACGAVGHRDTHVLVPAGTECMWYWGREGALDRWYGSLHLHRQKSPRDWSAPLSALAARLGQPG